MQAKQTVFNYLKNIRGYNTSRKLLVLSVDDYGNIRIASPSALIKLKQSGLKMDSRFDNFDTLETREDVDGLFDVLTSVKDCKGNSAVFTPFAVPCNIDYDKIKKSDFQKYSYELLTDTFIRLSAEQPNAYEGTWSLITQGIKEGIYKPQFHGREHLNLKIFNEKLQKKDPQLIIALNNNSYPELGYSGYSTISQMAAFNFWKFQENDSFIDIISDGLNAFEMVFGYKSTHFNSPGGKESHVIHKMLANNGIKYIDTQLFRKEHLGDGNFKTYYNYTGKRNREDQLFIVRNVVFEPTYGNSIDWVNYAFKQIEAAFRLRKPAIISSHRVNFCGHLDISNRNKGLNDLKLLLKKVVSKWPDIEFISADALGDIIRDEIKNN
ncbi:MAG: hypothetical protein K9H61_14380 [Bacteroidia bacterium]|nr:hypothetical protein [Bacteroidia bacterium]